MELPRDRGSGGPGGPRWIHCGRRRPRPGNRAL